MQSPYALTVDALSHVIPEVTIHHVIAQEGGGEARKRRLSAVLTVWLGSPCTSFRPSPAGYSASSHAACDRYGEWADDCDGHSGRAAGPSEGWSGNHP
ncbi:MAG: hypothetical protein EOM24_01055 [Chloroflexia bacterium]|nr:hypothetical protein [Chloroflexia bacterium]